MPYMQRITWSGIAIHAGVLPGYPASHGCIRMPMAFAVKMYGWTRMGARVVVTPDEMIPTGFSHPLLFAQKIVPLPVAADEPKADAPPPAKGDKMSEALAATKPANSAADLELRSTVGHDNGAKSMTDAAPATALLHEQTRTADASAFPITKFPVALSGAIRSSAIAIPAASDDAAKTEMKAGDTRAAATKIDAPKPTAKSDGNVKPVTDITVTSVPDQKKDQGRLPDPAKPPAAKPDAAALTVPKRIGQISVFISRKDSKLYVRQNFAPLFDVPVTIAPSDRPLGTHVFTAEVDKGDANVLHWSVISLPAPTRNAEPRDEDERVSRRRKMAGAAEMKPSAPEPDSPAEALDRLTIPEDARARIAEALSTGSSIIVSDQGIAGGETGEGTDFIVSLR
jgi:hypothetical protein